jgi:predicted RNase H-like HicB family nuclease
MHHHFRHPTKEGVVVIPEAENDDLAPRTARSALHAVMPSTRKGKSAARFLVVFERTTEGYSAYAPDLVGCVSTGNSIEAVEASMREAMIGHLEELLADGAQFPSPTASARSVEVAL